MLGRVLTGVSLMLALSACANMSSIERSSEVGTTRTFNHPAEIVSAAALESVRSLDVAIEKTASEDNAFRIYFSKPLSAFSWGEVGRVTVRPLEASATVVEVRAEKRSKFQLTGTDERKFARAIFAGIENRLPP